MVFKLSKFWHGIMTADLVFPMGNDFYQGNGVHQGICTAASLAWCRACLMGTEVRQFVDIGPSAHILNGQMHTLRRLDHYPRQQTDRANLEIVVDRGVSSVDEMLTMVKNTAPHTAIFWTLGHTMAYRYAHHQKEFFDVEEGLFRAKYTDAIREKINQRYANRVEGCRVVRLPH